jgi:hypothetical protein
MRITSSMHKCLARLEREGEAVRVWFGKGGDQWSWRVGGAPMTQQVHRCFQAGLVQLASRDRVVLSLLGQRVLAENPVPGPLAPTTGTLAGHGRRRQTVPAHSASPFEQLSGVGRGG